MRARVPSSPRRQLRVPRAAKSPPDQIGRLAFAAIDACLEPFITAADGRPRPLLSLCIDRDLGPRLLVNMDVLVWLRDGGLNVLSGAVPAVRRGRSAA